MAFIPRALGEELTRAARSFPAVILTGPRRAGKTTLLRRLFPAASYWLLEDPEIVARIRSDPRGFMAEARTPAILDEIQNVPEILNLVRAEVDAAPRRYGRWLLTGSQEAPLMRGVTESLAGRAAVLQLLPFSTRETRRVSLPKGGYPEVVLRPRGAALWFRSFVQTYLERDVRAVSAIRDLATYRRFLALLAARCGQILNRTELAAPLGISVPTLTQWLGILEVTGQIILVPPYFENFGKRLIKSPRIYFVDSGLACHLLGIDSERDLARSPFLGALYEGFVASEVMKQQLAAGQERRIYYFRDQQGLEVDLVIPAGHRRLLVAEVKASRSVTPAMATGVRRLSAVMRGYDVEGLVVHRPAAGTRPLATLAPGVRAVRLEGLLDRLAG